MDGFQFQSKSLAAVVITAFLIACDSPAAASPLDPYGFEKNSAIAVDSQVVGSRKVIAGRGSSCGHGHVNLDRNHHGEVEDSGSSFFRFGSLAAKRVAPPPPPMRNQKTSMQAFSPPPLLQ